MQASSVIVIVDQAKNLTLAPSSSDSTFEEKRSFILYMPFKYTSCIFYVYAFYTFYTYRLYLVYFYIEAATMALIPTSPLGVLIRVKIAYFC